MLCVVVFMLREGRPTRTFLPSFPPSHSKSSLSSLPPTLPAVAHLTNPRLHFSLVNPHSLLRPLSPPLRPLPTRLLPPLKNNLQRRIAPHRRFLRGYYTRDCCCWGVGGGVG